MSAPGGSSSKKVEAAKALLKSAWRSSEAFIRNKTKTELLVLEATNDVAWGPTGQQMGEIAEASFNAENFRQVWGIILQRFECEPAQWRRIYKALLLTEHLLKNSSQHVVQTILDAAGVIEGLKQFKFLDEKNKDQGINVSNRAKELMMLLADPDRIRAERAKAKALKGKFSGASKEDMVASGAPIPSAGSWTSSVQPMAGSASSSRGGFDDSRGPSTHFGQLSLGGGGSGSSGSPRPGGHSALPAHDLGDQEDEEEELAGGRGSSAAGASRAPAKGYATVLPADPVAATEQRIDSLRQAGMLREELHSSGAASSASAGASPTAPMRSSHSYDDLSVARSGGSQTKPSLAELMARRAGPKKLQDVHINPAIKAALGGIKLAPPPAPPAAHAHGAVGASPTTASPGAGASLLPPPPAAAKAAATSPPAAVHQGSSMGGGYSPVNSASSPSSPVSPTALPGLLSTPAQALVAPHSPAATLHGSPGGSPSLASSPKSPAAAHHQAVPIFDAFGLQSGGGSCSGAAVGLDSGFVAFSKPAASPAHTINLTAAAGPAPGSLPALPAHLFAEPALLPAYGSAASWGNHVAGVAPKAYLAGSPKSGSGSGSPTVHRGVAAAARPVVAAGDPFAEFDPFKGA